MKAAKILVVEDDPIARELLIQLLRMQGHDVLSAPSGERALLVVREHRGEIDALLTAVELPGLVDGWIVGDEFHACHPGGAAVYTSRQADEISRPGAPLVLRRPMQPMEALAAIKALLEPQPTEAPAPWSEPQRIAA